MGADHRGDPAVEPAGDGDLLARRLGVEVDDHDLRLLPRLLDERVDHLERPAGDVEEQPAHQVDDRDRRAVGRRGDRERAARRTGCDVRRADHPLRLLEVGRDLVARPDVVAQRDDIRTGGEQLVGELRRQPASIRGVLAVDDAERRRRAPRGAPGSRSSTARRPGEPNTSARKRMRIRPAFLGLRRGGGADGDLDVVAGVLRVARERELLDPREVDHRADLRGALRSAPSRRSARGRPRRCATERTSDGSLVGWMSITEPYCLPFRT